MTDYLDRLLTLDPLAEAERVTGESYKDDDSTMALGFLLAQEHSAHKAAALAATNDTFYNVTWLDFISIIEDEGFVVGYAEQFTGRDGVVDEFLVATSARGLIAADSYSWSPGDTRKVNGAKFWFNYETSDEQYWPVGCSGRFSGDAYDAGRRVWIGDKDIREGFRHFLHSMDAHGTFVTPWIERPRFWLTHYGDNQRLEGVKDFTERIAAYDRTTAVRLAQTLFLEPLGLTGVKR